MSASLTASVSHWLSSQCGVITDEKGGLQVVTGVKFPFSGFRDPSVKSDKVDTLSVVRRVSQHPGHED